MIRIGNGYDVHVLAEGRKLMLGGVEIPHTKGVLGHSDGDVLVHAIMDAMLGALALGDIGQHFPDTDMKYENIDSTILLKRVKELIAKRGYKLSLLEKVIDQLAQQNPLDERHHDHTLSGEYSGFRECHITPDWLLIYQIQENELILLLARTGTHSDLF